MDPGALLLLDERGEAEFTGKCSSRNVLEVYGVPAAQ